MHVRSTRSTFGPAAIDRGLDMDRGLDRGLDMEHVLIETALFFCIVNPACVLVAHVCVDVGAREHEQNVCSKVAEMQIMWKSASYAFPPCVLYLVPTFSQTQCKRKQPLVTTILIRFFFWGGEVGVSLYVNPACLRNLPRRTLSRAMQSLFYASGFMQFWHHE